MRDQRANTAAHKGLDPELIAELERMYGFDKPAHERLYQMIVRYLQFDFGESFYRDQTVVDIVLDKMPVSISLGLWTTLLVYLISIPLGVTKAVRDGSKFDVWTSGVIVIGNAVPGFMFAIFLIVLFAGGSYFDFFPLRGLTSSEWDQFGLFHKITDYFWHLALPIASMAIGGFAGLTLLTKNSFFGRNQQTIRHDRASKGIGRASRIVRARFSQCDANCDRGIPECICQYLVHRFAIDRDYLFARWVGPPGL